jgi:hypothetical protein
LMAREHIHAVCCGLRTALAATYGVPEQILTDDGQGVHRSVQSSAGGGAI